MPDWSKIDPFDKDAKMRTVYDKSDENNTYTDGDKESNIIDYMMSK